MNALTKVLVVLVLCLSVGFAVAQMALHGKREDLLRKYDDATAQLQKAQKDRDEAKGQLDDTRQALDQTKNKYDTEVRQLTADLADQKALVTGLGLEKQNLTTSVQSLTETTNKQATQVDALNVQIGELRTTLAQRDQAITDNLAKIDGLQNTLAQRNTTIDDLNFQLVEAKKEIKKLADSEERLLAVQTELRNRGVAVPPVQLPVINGRVVRVDTGLGVAVIDKGSKDQVKPNSEFTVYRDNIYVGRLVILDVQPDISAGRVRLLADGKAVEQGDKVTTQIP
jgi:uncharacterized protein (DUF3084 family)